MRSVLHKTGLLSQSCAPTLPTTCKCRIARQHLDAEALTADRLGHREYEPDKQKPDRREWGIFLATRGPVFQKRGRPIAKS